jgi:GNAT superfamily N-acetyltransferase
MDVTLVRAVIEDAETILEGQRNAFLPMLERYNDGDMDPANEKLENIQKAIRGQHFYKILADGKFAGALLIEEERGGERLKLHTLYVLPELQNMGIGGRAIDIAERLHQGAADWTLNCPADLPNNRHLYEKKGYIKRGEQKINDALTIVYYTKCGDAAAAYEAIAAREAKRDGLIELVKGQSVSVGEAFFEQEGWDGWYYCTAAEQSGWVHESVLDIHGGKGVAKEYYSSNELDLEKGERLRGIAETGGWVWCENSRFERGWVPLGCLKRL